MENEIVVGNSTSLNASVNLFSGLANHHNLKKSKLNLQSAQLSVAQTKEDVYLNVTACYLEILYAEDNIHIAEQIIKELYIQIDKISLKVETGKSTEADLLQIQTKLAEAENELLIAKQNFDIARLNLCYMLEIKDYTSLYLSKHSEPEFLQMDIALSNALLDELVINRPEMKMAEINVEISKCNLNIARSAYYPTISLNIGYGSSFSDARLKTLHNIDGTYRQESYPFIEQYVGNANSYASISINFPIFSKLSIRNNVNRHKILVQQSEYALLQTNKQVRREITQALIEARAACAQYNSATKAVEKWASGAPEIRLRVVYGDSDSATTVFTSGILEPAKRGDIPGSWWNNSVDITNWRPNDIGTVLTFDWREADWDDDVTFTIPASFEVKIREWKINAGGSVQFSGDEGGDIIGNKLVYHWDEANKTYDISGFKWEFG